MDTTGVNEFYRSEGSEKQERADAASSAVANVEDKARSVSRTAADKLHRAAAVIRERTNGNGDGSKMTRLADSAATKMDNAASYVEDVTFSSMRRDLGGVIQRYPLQSLAIGVGFGFIASRLVRRS